MHVFPDIFRLRNQSRPIAVALAIVSIYLLVSEASRASEYYISSTLLSDCRESINIWEGKPGDHHAGAMCLGFINGVLTSQNLYRANTISCRPDKIPPGAVAYALDRYAKMHPHRLGDSASVLLEDVVDAMYQCPQNVQGQ